MEEKSARTSNQDRIKELEKELSTTKYNKRTQLHIGLVKAKIAMLKAKLEARGKGQKKGEGYTVRKTGDATVVLLGFPSVGKSTLLNKLTNAHSEVGSYAFTTLTCIPGLLEYHHAKIQVLDVPGIVEGAAAGTGRGKEVLQVVRNADLVLVLLDVFQPEHHQVILKEIEDTHVRINQRMPDVKIVKTAKGGIDAGSTVPLTKIDIKTIEAICKEMRLTNAQIVLRDDIDAGEFIDIIEKNRVYIPAIIVVNKIDLATEDQILKVQQEIQPDIVVSAESGEHIEELKQLIFDRLKFIRIYLKEIGHKADMDVPLIMKSPASIQDICEKLHRDFIDKFRYARIWGKSVRFDGQKLLKTGHILMDEDILELHLK